MELYQLEYLVAIHEHKTILKAAQALNVAQPSMTKAIKKLEDEFGFLLFDRNKNRLVINESGLCAVEHAQRVLEEINNLKRATIKTHQNNLVLNLASNAPAPLWAVNQLLTSKVNNFISSDNEALIKGFHNLEYDMIILDYPINKPNIKYHKVCDEQLFIAVKPNHELSHKAEVTFDDINGYNILQISNVGYWYEVTTEHLPLSKFVLQENVENYNILLEASDLPVFRTNLTIEKYRDKENRVYIPITDPEAKLSFYAIYHQRNDHLFKSVFENIHKVDYSKFKPF